MRETFKLNKLKDIRFQDMCNKNEDNCKQENMCYTGQ